MRQTGGQGKAELTTALDKGTGSPPRPSPFTDQCGMGAIPGGFLEEGSSRDPKVSWGRGPPASCVPPFNCHCSPAGPEAYGPQRAGRPLCQATPAARSQQGEGLPRPTCSLPHWGLPTSNLLMTSQRPATLESGISTLGLLRKSLKNFPYSRIKSAC